MVMREKFSEEIADERMRAWRAHHDARLEREVPSVLQQVTALLRPYSPLIGSGFLVILFFLYRSGTFGWGSLPPYKLTAARGTSASDPCANKERCVIAFLAPWCGACQGSPPYFEGIRKNLETNDKVGMTVIVGKGDAQQQQAIVRQFESSVFVDYDGSFAKLSNVGMFGVPATMVINSEGKILERASGTLGGNADGNVLSAFYIKKHLGLSDYYPHLTAADEMLTRQGIGCHGSEK